MKKAFINNVFFSKSKWRLILDKAFSLRPAFLHFSSIRVLKESFQSILAPKSRSCVVLFISIFSTIKLTILLVLQINLHYWTCHLHFQQFTFYDVNGMKYSKKIFMRKCDCNECTWNLIQQSLTVLFLKIL